MRRTESIDVTLTAVFLAIGVAIMCVGCATSAGVLPTPEHLLAEEMVGKDVDKASLARGRALVVTECTTCHRLYWPQEYSPEEWEGVIRKMGKLAALSDSQIEDIRLYLTAASRAQHVETGAAR